jgi:hypothetical protein
MKTIIAVLILAASALGQSLPTYDARCDDSPNVFIGGCKDHYKEVVAWCKATNNKASLKEPTKCWDAFRTGTEAAEAKKEAEAEAARRIDQVEIDKAAMAAYAEFGKPTGLSFKEWEEVEVHAWQADFASKLGFADWLKAHLISAKESK